MIRLAHLLRNLDVDDRALILDMVREILDDADVMPDHHPSSGGTMSVEPMSDIDRRIRREFIEEQWALIDRYVKRGLY